MMESQNNNRDPQRESDEEKQRRAKRAQRSRRLDQIGMILLIFAIAAGIMYLFYASSTQKEDKLRYSEVVAQFEMENVRSFRVEGNRLTMSLYQPYEKQPALTYELYDVQMFREDLGSLIDSQYNRGIITSYDYARGMRAPGWSAVLPFVLLLVILGGFWYIMALQRGAAGGQMDRSVKFGKANVHQGVSDGKKVTFSDVAGAQEEKE